ncbi:MAG: FadR family transcriptional regulator [Moorella humiferrea]|uniref:Putative L-lactate dehydrogenase operon regulatory protein n=1 Tax=Neomoorella humiferrea TaxID=676965 RepID=A0A2T0ARH4_9FIRM|nr:FadR/GntR family transcriptional regulator [Moorella humiferrea]MBE3571542.1 FadR family transcriptional regulator [Moorella humiferrea]PRR72454.1 putative L-lactate dehydrogenase operon regulatory protein [Moorella humiferrea]
MELKPIRPKKIYEEIVRQIKDLIGEGNLKPGDRLPSERELSERLGVSRASVREALSALAAMGVIDIRPGEGTFVQNVRREAIVEPLAMALLMDRQAAMELLEARQALEGEAAYLAACRAGPEDIEKMAAILKEMDGDLKKGTLGEEADLRFHLAIAEAARNSVLAKLMHTVSDTMRQALRTSRQRLYTTPGNPELLFEQHKQIFEAIKNQKPRAARRAICQHLRFVERELQKE